VGASSGDAHAFSRKSKGNSSWGAKAGGGWVGAWQQRGDAAAVSESIGRDNVLASA
jgi:hypothetical protein